VPTGELQLRSPRLKKLGPSRASSEALEDLMPKHAHIRVCLLVAAAGLLAAQAVSADELQRIVLRDGSVIVAEVRSLEEGRYGLRSRALGDFKVEQARILRIESAGVGHSPGTAARRDLSKKVPTPAAKNDAATAASIQELQMRMLSSGDMLTSILKLRSSPEMQEVLADPEIQAAIMSGDLDALQRNPKMLKLMKSPDMRVITEDLAPGS
jgi:hypothetical protein